MAEKISFVVLGEPVSKLRAVVTNKLDRNGKKIVFTPVKTEIATANFQVQSLRYRPDKPLDGPVSLMVRFYRSIPKSFSRKKRVAAIEERIFPTTKPDLDNCLKLVKDAMNKIFYLDDSQVVHEIAWKFYSERPRIEVVLSEIE